MLFWVFYSIITLLWIKDVFAWGKIFIFLLGGLVTTWFIGLYFTRKIDIINALKILEVISFLFGCMAIYEIFTGNYFFIDARNLIFYNMRSEGVSTIGLRIPITVFANPNNYSLFLLFSIFSSFGLSKIKKAKTGRVISLIITLFFVFLLVSTQSRSAFIGLVLGILAYILILFQRVSARNIWRYIFVASAVLICIGPWLAQSSDWFGGLLFVDFGRVGSDMVRLNLIKNGFEFLIKTFFLGVGLGNIEYYMANFQIYPTGSITNIHNWWMEIFVSSGIFVFMAYVIIYLKNLFRLYCFSFIGSDNDTQHLAAVFFSFLIAFFIASVGSSSLMYNEWIWPILAIVMSYINLYNSQTKNI
jgi:teichuronic acid biosynthesis protein TuaE